MKKHLSVFGLFARSSIYRVLVVMLFMGIAEAGLFWHGLQETLADYNNLKGMEAFEKVADVLHFEEIIDKNHISWCFAAAFILITFFICLPGTEYQSKTGYTLRRLSVSEKSILLIQAIYNMAVYFILLAVQVLICFEFYSLYTSQIPAEFVGNQTIFLAFYRSDFLHSILPLSEIWLWIRNAFLVVGLGFAAAEFPYRQRRKGYGAAVIVLGVYTVLNFKTEIGSIGGIVFAMCVMAIYAGNVIYNVFCKEEPDEN